jgi:glycosyltransferase involved in cell wall biosynthesis
MSVNCASYVNKKIKILIISYTFPPCTIGAGTVMYNLCKNLPKYSYSVMTTKKEVYINAGVYDQDYKLSCPTIRLPARSGSRPDQIIFLYLSVLKGLSLIKKERFDCILAVSPSFYDLISAFVLKKLTRTPFVIHMHDLFSETKMRSLTRGLWITLENRIFRSASRIIIMNEHYRRLYSRRGFNNTVVVPPSIDLANYHSSEATPAIPRSSEKKMVIVYTGSVYGSQKDAVFAFLKAAKSVSDIDVLFATGYLEDYVKGRLKEVNVGFLSKKKCTALQKSADVLFLPLSHGLSYSEEEQVAFPSKLLEYLAAGKPILAVVPKGSFVESFVREHEVGLVVNDLSEEKIVAAITELKDKDRRYLFSQNSLKTAELFNAELWGKMVYVLLSEIILKKT